MLRYLRLARIGWALLAAMCLLAAPGASAGLLGVEAVTDETPYVLGDEPVTLLLSKSKYPAEDQHLDAIVWLQAPDGGRAEGELEVSLHDERGAALSREAVRPLPGERAFFSVPFPEDMAGHGGSLRVIWVSGGREVARAERPFSVLPAAGAPTSGRVRLTVPNDVGAALDGLPVTIGVPFPRGALQEEANVRLVDGEGREVPLQTKVASRWSRFGSVRWLQCDFAADVDGGPLDLFLEYGPDVSRAASPGLQVHYQDLSHGMPPVIDAGPVRFGPKRDDETHGIEFDAGDGRGFRQVVSPESLHGAFVEHEDGKRFVLPADAEWEAEEQGPQKMVLRRRGWYVLPGTEERFCKFDTRYTMRRGSPVVQVLHTWIFTGYPYEDLYRWRTARTLELFEGEGDADRIRNMGWRFGLADGMEAEGFLTAFGEGGEWRQGDYLLQHDFDKYEIAVDGETVPGDRAAGVAAASGGGARMLLGVKDFWQNFPNELEFSDGALFFHQWPRHGKPAGRHPPRVADGLRLWFAHEGEVLDFAVPAAYTDDPEFQRANPNNYHLHGRRQTMNAQGVAKTDEMWLLFVGEDTPADEAAKVLEGLNDGTLRAFVDPEWTASSGAFYEMHHRDMESYPEDERIYEMHALAPYDWIERMRFYGKWIWGDMWWGARLRQREWTSSPAPAAQGLYRGFRKSHQGWPYSWMPFARSGDARFWRLADAATRHMADVAFCNYSDERVPPWRGGSRPENPVRPRWRGFYNRHHIPWSSYSFDPTSRDYSDKNNYLWHSYYLTGYPRARDVAMDWAHLCKHEGASRWTSRADYRGVFTGDEETFFDRRQVVTMLQSFVEHYQATFDPWFLAAAHQVARNNLRWFRENDWRGHFWNPGPREFHRFTNCDEFAEFYMAYAYQMSDPHRVRGWASNTNKIEPAAYGYWVSGDDWFLKRAAGWLDRARHSTFDGEPAYYRGMVVRNADRNAGPMFTGYYLQHFPYALAAFERAGRKPDPAPSGFVQLNPAGPQDQETGLYPYRYQIALRKEAGEVVPLRLRIQQELWTRDAEEFKEVFRYRVLGPDGGTVLEGEWDVKAPEDAAIPADALAGTYRLTVEGESVFRPDGSRRQMPALYLPVSAPGVHEIMELPPEAPLGRTFWMPAHYCFEMPKGLGEFWVEFSIPPFHSGGRWCDLVALAVLDADDNVAWSKHFAREDEKVDTVRAEVPVPADQAERVWRIVVAGESRGIKLDPAIPRVFSISPGRWFRP